MSWPLWKKELEEDRSNPEPTRHTNHQSSMNFGIHDTVDSFKLEPSNKVRHDSLRQTFNVLRQMPSNIGSRMSQLHLKRRPSATGTFFEPTLISEYKKLRYITNRDFSGRQSVARLSTGQKSGTHDKHCVFVSITGITLKLGLSQRRPINPASNPGISWSSKGNKDRIPRYASATAPFSIRLSDSTSPNSQSKHTMYHNVAHYMAKDKTVSTNTISSAKLLRRSLEYQAQDLYRRFSASSSTESLDFDSLGFVWDEMGLRLQPLSATQTSLYEVLTKDREQNKKCKKETHRKPSPGAKENNEKKSPKKMSEKKTSKQNHMDELSSVGKTDFLFLDGADEKRTKKKKMKEKVTEKDKEEENMKRRSNLLRISKSQKENASISSEMQAKFSQIEESPDQSPHGFSSASIDSSNLDDSDQKQKKRKESKDRLKKEKKDSRSNFFLKIPKKAKGYAPSSPKMRISQDEKSPHDSPPGPKINEYLSFEQIMDSNIPIPFDRALQEDIMSLTRPTNVTDVGEQSLKPERSRPEKARDGTTSHARGLTKTEPTESFQKTLDTPEKIRSGQGALPEKRKDATRTPSFEFKLPDFPTPSQTPKNELLQRIPSEYKTIPPSRIPSGIKSQAAPTKSSEVETDARSDFRQEKPLTSKAESQQRTFVHLQSGPEGQQAIQMPIGVLSDPLPAWGTTVQRENQPGTSVRFQSGPVGQQAKQMPTGVTSDSWPAWGTSIQGESQPGTSGHFQSGSVGEQAKQMPTGVPDDPWPAGGTSIQRERQPGTSAHFQSGLIGQQALQMPTGVPSDSWPAGGTSIQGESQPGTSVHFQSGLVGQQAKQMPIGVPSDPWPAGRTSMQGESQPGTSVHIQSGLVGQQAKQMLTGVPSDPRPAGGTSIQGESQPETSVHFQSGLVGQQAKQMPTGVSLDPWPASGSSVQGKSQLKTLTGIQAQRAVQLSIQTESSSRPTSRDVSKVTSYVSSVLGATNIPKLKQEKADAQDSDEMHQDDDGDRFYDCISLEEEDSEPQNFFGRLPASLAHVTTGFFSQIFGKAKRGKEKERGDKDDDGFDYFTPRSYSQPDLTKFENFRDKEHGDEDDSGTVYFSPKSYSQPDLVNFSNSNSASPMHLLYSELLMTQLELKQLWIENTHLRAQLRQGIASNKSGNLT